MDGLFKFDKSQTDFLRNFEGIANHSLANLRDIQDYNFKDQGNRIADQLNFAGVSPESGVYGAALGELGRSHQLDSANLLRDLQSQLLGQRGDELGRMFDESKFNQEMALKQQVYADERKDKKKNKTMDTFRDIAQTVGAFFNR